MTATRSELNRMEMEGPPTTFWDGIRFLPLTPFIALIAWLPFTVLVVLPIAFAWEMLAGAWQRYKGCGPR